MIPIELKFEFETMNLFIDRNDKIAYWQIMFLWFRSELTRAAYL